MSPIDNTKPLSQKPLGYILAVLGGTLGGPLGWVISPAVLVVLNKIFVDTETKKTNRFLIWSLIGIVGAPISISPFMGKKDVNVVIPDIASNKTTLIPSSQGITLAKYMKLNTGMTYDDVVSILGKNGVELSSTEIAGIKSVTYKWDGVSFASNMNATFSNNQLVSKAQFGLK